MCGGRANCLSALLCQVYGGLCSALVSGYQSGVLQHVRAADPQRTMRRLDSPGHQTHAVQGLRSAQTATGMRAPSLSCKLNAGSRLIDTLLILKRYFFNPIL